MKTVLVGFEDIKRVINIEINSKSDDNLRKVQLRCLEIMQNIDALCRKHDIQYSLTGGSVIGVYLYQGFIPWDDDIDIMMTRENYDRFLRVCESELPNGYILKNFENGKDKSVLFSKVEDENTTLVERKAGGKNVIGGIFVDVTVFDKLPRNKLARWYFTILSKAVQCCMERGVEGDLWGEALLKRILTKMIKVNADGFYQYVKKRFVNCKTQIFDYTELLAGFTTPYSVDLFKEYSDVIFEGRKFMIVKDYMYYLKMRYGKTEFYREQKAGDAPHHFVYVDCNKPYREYQLNDKFY